MSGQGGGSIREQKESAVGAPRPLVDGHPSLAWRPPPRVGMATRDRFSGRTSRVTHFATGPVTNPPATHPAVRLGVTTARRPILRSWFKTRKTRRPR